MSSAQAMQRRRKMNGVVTSSTSPQAPDTPKSNLPTNSLSKVITHIDERLKKIENLVVNTSSQVTPTYDSSEKIKEIVNGELSKIGYVTASTKGSNIVSDEVIDEYEHRFSILSKEINEIKDIIMKLQNFTFEVNQQMFDYLKNTNKTTKHQNENILDVSANNSIVEESTFESMMKVLQEENA